MVPRLNLFSLILVHCVRLKVVYEFSVDKKTNLLELNGSTLLTELPLLLTCKIK